MKFPGTDFYISMTLTLPRKFFERMAKADLGPRNI